MHLLVERLKGVRRHWQRGLVGAFATYGFLWGLYEPAQSMVGFEPKNVWRFVAMVGISLAVGLWRALPPHEVQFKIKTTNTVVRIGFGDLFAAPGFRVIPANEYFDSRLGPHVAEKTLHGQLLRRMGGQPEAFEARVDESLAGVPSKAIDRPDRGRTRQYPVGTTALVPVNNERYLVLAFCTTHIHTSKASADVPQLWNALEGLWNKATALVGGETISVPLIGGGQSGVGLPPAQLLQLLVLSAVEHSKREQITSEINIVLPESCFNEIDLTHIKDQWS